MAKEENLGNTPSEITIIEILTLPEPTFLDWPKKRVLLGAKEPTVIDFNQIIADVYFHEQQRNHAHHPTGHEILASLVKSYRVGEDTVDKTYQVKPDDAVNGHYGMKEIRWLGENWKVIPESFRKWAKGKLLYGHRDIARLSNGLLNSPYLGCDTVPPYFGWYDLSRQLLHNEPGLRQTSPQG